MKDTKTKLITLTIVIISVLFVLFEEGLTNIQFDSTLFDNIQLFTTDNNDNSNDIAESTEGMINPISVHFIDVGQGDSTLIQTATQNILIDAGEDSAEKDVINYLNKFNITKLDYVVATHPHSDHIGGLDGVINNFEVTNILMPDVTHTTKTFENLITAIETNNTNVIIAQANQTITLDDITYTVLSPLRTSYDNLNNYSVVIKMDYNNVSFMFGGDAEKLVETDILNNNYNVDVDILKVSHHGSNTSSSPDFISAMSPTVAVISCGLNNDYGHPHQEVLQTLTANNAKLYTTPDLGNITVTTDGNLISVTSSK